MITRAFFILMKLSGWKFINNVPDNLRSFVLIGAPHTSNHDFIPAMALSWFMQRNAKFVIKDDWMKFPMGLIMKPLGAHGIDRKNLGSQNRESNIETMAKFFQDFQELVLMICPEGTRGPVNRWKTGFYYMAQKAQVPIVLAFADYEKKETGLARVLYPTDFETDMRTIMEFYRSIKGKCPQKFMLDHRFS